MKKLIALGMALILASTTLLAQEKFTGIGKIKIGIDSSLVETLAKDNDLKLAKVNSFMDSYTMRSGGFGKIPFGTKEYIPDAPDVAEVSVYKFSVIKIADIEIKNVVLKFFENKLYSFKSDYSRELSQAMELKYPDFTKRTKSDTTACIYKATGNKVNEVSTMYISEWKNGTIVASTNIGDYYNDKCQRQFLSYVSYLDLASTSKVQAITLKMREEKRKKDLEATKSKLSEF